MAHRRPGSAALAGLGLIGIVGVGMILAGCSDTELIVDVGNIPAAATELRAIVRSDGVQSRDIPRFPFTEGRSTYSIGLKLRGRTSGAAQITIGSFSHDCLISTAILSLDDLGDRPERLSVNLDPPRSETLAQTCPSSVPLLVSAEAVHDGGTSHLVLHGWGFDPAARAFLANSVTEAADAASINPLVLRVALPELVPPINNSLKVHVVNPDGSAGDGTFTVSLPVLDTGPTLYPSTPQDPFLIMTDVVADDLDGDGRTDIVLCGNTDVAASGRLRVYWNDGNGRFSPGGLLPVSGLARHIAAARLRPGMLQDLIVTTGRLGAVTPGSALVGGNLVVLQQTAPRTFSAMAFTNADDTDATLVPYALAAADLTGDGLADVAVVTNSAVNPYTGKSGLGDRQQLRIYDGSALVRDRFLPLATRDLSGQGAPLAMVAGDLGIIGGGPLDLAIARTGLEPGSGAVDIYDNPGDGHFEGARVDIVLLEGRPGGLTVADLDRDGRSDLAASILFTLQGSQEVYGSTANILFRRNPQWLKQTVLAGLAPLSIATADLQANGIPDLVVTNLRINTQPALLGLLFNLGGGQFASSAPTMIELPTAASAVISSADLNADGRSDLAVAPTGIASGASKQSGTLLTFLGL